MILLVVSSTYAEFDRWARLTFPDLPLGPQRDKHLLNIRDEETCQRALSVERGMPYVWLSNPERISDHQYIEGFLIYRRCVPITVLHATPTTL